MAHVQLDVLFYDRPELQSKLNTYVSAEPEPYWMPKIPQFWIGETWWISGQSVMFRVKQELMPEGYEFHHAEITNNPTIYNTNPFTVSMGAEVHYQDLRIFMSKGGIPTPNVSVSAQWDNLRVLDLSNNDNWNYVSRTDTNDAVCNVGEERRIQFQLTITNNSQQSFGYRFGLQALSDEGLEGDIIYEPPAGYRDVDSQQQITFVHEIILHKYSAWVEMWLEGINRVTGDLGTVTGFELFRVIVDTGVPSPIPEIGVGGFLGTDGDNGFWIWMLIALIVIMTFIGAYGGYWVKKKKLI